jgi:aldehyde:ferredoxin oxidoreductase
MGIDRFFKDAEPLKMVSSKKDRLDPKVRMKNQVLNSKMMQIINGVGMCLFGMGCGPKTPIFEWLNAATGWNKTPEDYLVVAERIETLRHSFNVREGIKPKDFKMTGRARGEPPLEYGPHKGVTLRSEEAQRLFYEAFGWDPETGKPRKEVLEKLGLNEVIKDFYG